MFEALSAVTANLESRKAREALQGHIEDFAIEVPTAMAAVSEGTDGGR